MNHIFMISRLASSIQSFQKGDEPHPRHFDRSEAEWRNLLSLMVRAALLWEISRHRASGERFPSAPYRHAAPLEMTMAVGSIQSFQKEQMTKTLPPSTSFRPQRCGVEKSPPLMVRVALRREISRLRVSWARFLSAPYRHAAPLEMTVLAGSIQSFHKGTNDKNAAPIHVISTEAKRSGEISRP